MINNSKDIRMLQIAAMILYRNVPNITLVQSNDNAYDILCSSTIDELRFGINVVSSSFSTSNTYEHYLNYLDSIDYSDKNYRIPILLMAVNESTETAMIGIQVGWRFGRPIVFKKPTMRSVTQENADKIINSVKMMDNTIRMLSEHGMKIVKTIAVESIQHNGRAHHAKIVYLRDFTEQYKMKQKIVVDEREKFNRLFNGIPEDEYPNDFLDDSILEMVNQKFSGAKLTSSMMLFSSDLRDLQQLAQSIRMKAEMFVEPNLTNIPNAVLSMLDGVKFLHFNIDFFIDAPYCKATFENLSLHKTEPMEGWLRTYNKYDEALKTLHSPTKFFV